MSEQHIKGLAELQKFMDQLTPKLEKNVMRGALRAGMKVVLPVAKANIHPVSGELAAGLKLSTRHKGSTVMAIISTKGRHGYIAPWVEYGTRLHYIKVQESEKPLNINRSIRYGEEVRASMRTINRNVLRIGARFVGPSVLHPGSQPKPFMRPALDTQATAAVVAAAEYMKKRLATKHGLDTADVVIEASE